MTDPPSSKAEFAQLMEEIDKAMRDDDVPILGRPLVALSEICKRFGLSYDFRPLPSPPPPGIYRGDALFAHVKKWFVDRYGRRLSLGHGPGSTVMLVRGDPWRFKVPWLAGQIRFVCDLDLSNPETAPRSGRFPEPPKVNLLRYIDGLPIEVVRTLDERECRAIGDFFTLSYDTVFLMWQLGSRGALLAQAAADLQASADHLMSTPPHYGLTRWTSAQCVEKLLKAYIDARGRRYRRIHDLAQLAQQAAAYGARPLSGRDLEDLRCKAAVRYDDEASDLGKAVVAHQAAVRISGILGSQIRELLGLDRMSL